MLFIVHNTYKVDSKQYRVYFIYINKLPRTYVEICFFVHVGTDNEKICIVSLKCISYEHPSTNFLLSVSSTTRLQMVLSACKPPVNVHT